VKRTWECALSVATLTGSDGCVMRQQSLHAGKTTRESDLLDFVCGYVVYIPRYKSE